MFKLIGYLVDYDSPDQTKLNTIEVESLNNLKTIAQDFAKQSGFELTNDWTYQDDYITFSLNSNKHCIDIVIEDKRCLINELINTVLK